MSSPQENINKVSTVIDDGATAFLEGVEKSQSGIFNKVLASVKGLETGPDGNIKQTVKNLRILSSVRKSIENEVITDAYIKRVNTLTNQYPAIASLNNEYYGSIEAAFNPNRELYNQIIDKSIQTTKASLLDSGISEAVINPIVRIVDDSTTSGAMFADMVDELRLVIKGDPERLGNLMRYSSQITQDALNQFNGVYNETIAKDLDLDWYYYSGGKRRTSRPFCKKYAGRYFHKKEVEDFGRKKDLDGSALCGGSSKTDLCQGRIPGTNSSSIFRYRAGYNCKHIYKPTLIDAVPKKVIDRNIKKGYYVPEGVAIEPTVPKSATKQVEFVPAKTIEEATKRIEKAGVKIVKIDGLKKPQYNAVLESIEKENAFASLKLNKLETYRKPSSTAKALFSPSNNSLSINMSKLNVNEFHEVVSYADQVLADKKSIQFMTDNYLGNPKFKQSTVHARINSFNNRIFKVEQQIKGGEKARPWSVSSAIEDKNEALQATMFHELGHNRYYENLKEPSFSFNKKRSVSEYGRASREEYFAEWYSKFKISGEKGVPDDLLKLFNSI